MTKRIAEKVISRSILTLAVYRKSTMGQAMRRRPRFWTVPRAVPGVRLTSPRRRLRLEFAKAKTGGGLAVSYEPGVQTSA
jgi:hypothetical protein